MRSKGKGSPEGGPASEALSEAPGGPCEPPSQSGARYDVFRELLADGAEARQTGTMDDHIHKGCGACCMRVGMPPFIYRRNGCIFDASAEGNAMGTRWPEIFVDLPENLANELREHLRQHGGATLAQMELAGLPCIWLDLATRTCKHYEFRPEACRAYDCQGRDRREFQTRRQ